MNVNVVHQMNRTKKVLTGKELLHKAFEVNTRIIKTPAQVQKELLESKAKPKHDSTKG